MILTPPASLSQFILKVHSRCNLACDHCYVYEHADQGWRAQPLFMTPATARRSAQRIAEHASTHHLATVRLILHGGEPLLIGPERLDELLTLLRDEIGDAAAVEFRMQTNGILLSDAVCDLLRRHDVTVGVSLDGDAAANDAHRLYPNGNSSYPETVRGIDRLRTSYPSTYGGILCTIDLRNDPIRTYESIAAHAPPRIDFLLPHATWDNPPSRPDGPPAAYGRWLGTVYRRWDADGRPMDVRLFTSLLATAAGGRSTSEWVGLSRADLAVIETDGTWEQADSLKTAYDGAPRTGLSVFTHSVDQVAATPGIARRQLGLADLSDECRACPVVRQCGGGLYAHRYRTGTGFDNPSVYCEDLKELIRIVNEGLPAATATATGATATGASGTAASGTAASGLPHGVLAGFARGFGDEASVRLLADRQLDDTRTLLRAVARDRGAGVTAHGWETLEALDQTEAARDAVESVLCHPYVRQWAVDCLTGSGDPTYLCSVAAAVAVRSGQPARIDVPVRAGVVHLPTLGSLTVPAGPTAVVSTSASGFTVHSGRVTVAITDGDAPVDGWRPNRFAVMGGLPVLIEDLDPYRDCHNWTARDRLDDATAREWQARLSEAWEIIGRDAPHRLPGLRVGLRAVTPLNDDPSGRMRSASTRGVFGAIGLADATAESLATLIIHEFQH
ncbi:MAG TPA: FxsB family cyclophane-forming radical SAM/SPASM peptide maturase, partial [Micromonosporaceae bacterium]